MAFEVTCVTIDDRSPHDDCRCIETIGYKSSDGIKTRSPSIIHYMIDNGGRFYVKHNGSKTYLEPAERNGTKYVRTKPNGTKDDNLLQQPSC